MFILLLITNCFINVKFKDNAIVIMMGRQKQWVLCIFYHLPKRRQHKEEWELLH